MFKPRGWLRLAGRERLSPNAGFPVVAASIALVLAGAVSTVSLGWLSSDRSGSSALRSATTPTAPASVLALGEDAGWVPWESPLRVLMLNGTLHSVSVTSGGGQVAGQLKPLSWVSRHTLVPLHQYTISVGYADAAGQAHTKQMTVSARDSVHHTLVTLSPDGQTSGVGQPVVAYFSHSVPHHLRPLVTRRLSVTTAPAVSGAWHWISASEAHWRPPSYWKPGSRIHVSADISGINFGGGRWGGSPHTASFHIGDAHVSTVDVAKHTMTVRDNGRVVRVIAVSAGRDKYPTKSGVHIALSKSQVVTMDSATVGIPRNSPDGYYEKVYWDVRISDGGAFVHAAPWSVGAQGHRNVSHGCVNISTSEAIWFYNFSQRGDIVNIINSGASPDRSDPGMADWNVSWHEWLTGGFN